MSDFLFKTTGGNASHGNPFLDVLVVDEDLSVAERLRRVFASLAPDGRVTVADSCQQARKLLAEQSFTLALIGMGLPDNGGLKTVLHLREACAHTVPIAMSAVNDAQWVRAAVSAGAGGYLLTDADDADLLFLLRSLAHGGAPMDPRVMRCVLGWVAASAAQGATGKARSLLSARELRVLNLIAQGCSNRQIAETVYLSVNTIEYHAKSIFRKLEVKSRTQAVHEAMQHGLLN